MTPVARVNTRWTDPELLDAYDRAYRIVLAEVPSRAALAVLWAQANLECGRGGKSCWNFNVGNVRAGELEPHTLLAGAYEFAAVGKVPAGATIISPPAGAAVPPERPICYLLPSAAQRFRAYESLVDGCVGKISLVARRWPAAIEALRLAKDAAAARAYVLGLLVPPAYFTGDSAQYVASALSLTAECLRRPESDWPQRDTLPAPPDSDAPTWPGTPTSKSSQRLQAVREPIADLSTSSPATALRAGEGEHTVPLVETDFDEVP